MLIPLRFTIKTEHEEHCAGPYDVFVDPVPTVRIEIEIYDTAAAGPIVRGFQLLRAAETAPESMVSMTETVLEPGPLSEDHREYLTRLRDAVDGLLESGWRDVLP